MRAGAHWSRRNTCSLAGSRFSECTLILERDEPREGGTPTQDQAWMRAKAKFIRPLRGKRRAGRLEIFLDRRSQLIPLRIDQKFNLMFIDSLSLDSRVGHERLYRKVLEAWKIFRIGRKVIIIRWANYNGRILKRPPCLSSPERAKGGGHLPWTGYRRMANTRGEVSREKEIGVGTGDGAACEHSCHSLVRHHSPWMNHVTRAGHAAARRTMPIFWFSFGWCITCSLPLIRRQSFR